ncbi:MAG: response regulator [Ignavibacteriales bacterium]|nr:response regulator [Ignavibacteriales bacterium]
MKLNVRLILITSIIVLFISVVSTFIFYSLTGRLFFKYQSQAVLNSTNDFAFSFQTLLQQPEDDLKKILPELSSIKNLDIDSTSIDFIFTLVNDSLINTSEFRVKSKAVLNIRSRSFRQFFSDNPNAVLDYTQLASGVTIYYGFVISQETLNRVSEKIRAEVALVINYSPVEISNSEKNQKYLLSLVNASRDLRYKNNYDLYGEELENADFIASLFTPRQILTPGGKINFVIFSFFPESVDFRTTLRTVMILIVIAGAALTFILVLLSTTKLRRQISLLNYAAETASRGDFEHKVAVFTKDEIGKLGEAFNRMLDELKQKEKSEKEYTEFITLINQNPTLKEVSETALAKIIKSTGLTFGVLYIVEQKKLRVISSFGISRNLLTPTQEADFYSNAIEKKEMVEFTFKENYPEIQTGLASIKIKYLLIFPIVYNKETIAILEAASETIPEQNIKSYIGNIQEQLANGLINARSLEQLENFVAELKRLNEEYQKQNKQIVEQNEELLLLHQRLKEKADELEKQRAKAVELTKVKSQFLASMSHELRTPLISILGLTELMMKDSSAEMKFKERINIVNRSGKKLLSLITNILEFSKFESGKIDVKKESFLLGDFLAELQPNIEQLASEKELKFTVDTFRHSDILLNTDKMKLEQILTNLLVNAIKFTERGDVKLSISQKHNSELCFEVADTGIGISDEHKQTIFSEFKQIESGTDRKFGGAGLGLAICRRYVEMLGGEITLQSEPGKGSVFSVTLHDAILDVIELAGNQFMSLKDESAEKEIKKNILIVDQGSNTNKLLGDYLASYNYNVLLAGTIEKIYETINKSNVEAVILGSGKNEINIWQFIVNLKSKPSAQNPILIITEILEDKKIGWLPNIFEFAVKPLNEIQIKKMITKIELFSAAKVENIFCLTDNKSEFDVLKESYKVQNNLISVNKVSELPASIKANGTNLILVDVETMGTDSLRLCSLLLQKKMSKNNFVVFVLPDTIAEKLSAALNMELEKLTLESKNHPLDVLKDLKDRLAIDVTELNKKNNLIEETAERSTNVYLDQEKVPTKPTVLIVDDDNDSLFTIGEYVKEINCDTVFAHNGVECLLMLNHMTPDLILLDIMMPQMDGFETIKRIRSENKFADLPVVALTAYAMLDNKNIIERNGFNGLLTKPINFSLLESTVKTFVKEKVN